MAKNHQEGDEAKIQRYNRWLWTRMIWEYEKNRTRKNGWYCYKLFDGLKSPFNQFQKRSNILPSVVELELVVEFVILVAFMSGIGVVNSRREWVPEVACRNWLSFKDMDSRRWAIAGLKLPLNDPRLVWCSPQDELEANTNNNTICAKMDMYRLCG